VKNELIKSFVKGTVTKTIIFGFVMIVIAAVSQSVSPVITNELALTQMQNSNEMYIVMSTYDKIKPIFSIGYLCVISWFAYTIGRDIYRLSKNINTTN
jgi:hypothetical protein